MKRALVTVLALLIACESSSGDPIGPTDAGVVGFDAGRPSEDGPREDASGDSGSAPSADAGVTDGGDDAAVPLAAPDWYVDPATGDDANDGKSATSPFKTLCRARDAAQANDVIGLLDGTYDSSSQRPPAWDVTYPCGPSFKVPVTVRAVNQGKAVVNVQLEFQQGGIVDGLKLDTERPDGGGAWMGRILLAGGALSIHALTLGDVWSPPNAKAAPIVVSNGTATLDPGNVTNYMTLPVPASTAFTFAFLSGSGEIIMHGGTIDDSPAGNADSYCSPLFEGGGKLTLQGTTLRHKGTILRSSGAAVFEKGSVLENRSTAPNLGCGPVIGTIGPVAISVKDSTVRGGTAGIETEPGPGQGTITVTNSVIEGSSQYGINTASIGTPALAVKVRKSQVKSAAVGVRIAGSVTADLGTQAEPGGNNFAGSATTGVRVEATTVVDAAGNTWVANQQNADGMGKYTAGIHVGPLTGINFTLPSAATSIKL